MPSLAIFDIDGTLTDTNGVDDECYRLSVAEALEVSVEQTDWAGAAHVTDTGIFQLLCERHSRPVPDAAQIARTRDAFVERLRGVLRQKPDEFVAIEGAAAALTALERAGWRFALATGGWGASARLKLRAAGISVPDQVIACADDAVARADIIRIARARAERHYETQFERVVSLGDGIWDVAAAKALELPFIGIASGTRADALRAAGATHVLEDYTDLDAFMRALDTAAAPALPPGAA